MDASDWYWLGSVALFAAQQFFEYFALLKNID